MVDSLLIALTAFVVICGAPLAVFLCLTLAVSAYALRDGGTFWRRLIHGGAGVALALLCFGFAVIRQNWQVAAFALAPAVPVVTGLGAGFRGWPVRIHQWIGIAALVSPPVLLMVGLLAMR